MEKIQLVVKNRDKNEKASVLRKNGFIPGVIYNHGKSDSIKIADKDIQYLFSHGITESTLIEVDREGEKETAFVKDYQKHPVREDVLHLDLYRVTFGEKIKTALKIHLTGKAEGVKQGGILENFLHEVEIEALPKNLVPAIEVDISALNIGESLHVEDLPLPEDSRILTEGNPIVCTVVPPIKAAETQEEVASADTVKEEKPSEEKE